MKVLIIGSGGREHALAWKISQSPRVKKIFIAPGNGGTEKIGENIEISVRNFKKLAAFALDYHIDLTVVGPDEPLATGIVDYFQRRRLNIFGPSRRAAKIESSKYFSKNLMKQAGIPTASFLSFKNYNLAVKYVKNQKFPIVIKASGLASGKGVYICQTYTQAKNSLIKIMIDHIHGDSGKEVIVENFIDGQEISIHALSDGKTSRLFPPAQDHKTIFNNDNGPNTGGMGVYAPVPWVDVRLLRNIKINIVDKAIKELSWRKRPFKGCLYPGLKISLQGPIVLEYNARFGDPETQAYMRLLETDFIEIVKACLTGRLSKINIKWRPDYAVCVVLASKGYPGKYKTGFPITGIEKAEKIPTVLVFHAGTQSNAGRLITSGGRVLSITATGADLKTALIRAYKAVSLISFQGKQFRTDIGAKAFM